MDGAERLLVLLRSPPELPLAAADRPRPEPEPRDLHTGAAELGRLHRQPSTVQRARRGSGGWPTPVVAGGGPRDPAAAEPAASIWSCRSCTALLRGSLRCRSCPAAQENAPNTTAKALPSLSSCTLAEDSAPNPSSFRFGPNQIRCGGILQRAASCSELIVTQSSANTGGNSTCTIAPKELARSPSVISLGSTDAPGGVTRGARTVKPVVTVENGGASRCALIEAFTRRAAGPREHDRPGVAGVVETQRDALADAHQAEEFQDRPFRRGRPTRVCPSSDRTAGWPSLSPNGRRMRGCTRLSRSRPRWTRWRPRPGPRTRAAS